MRRQKCVWWPLDSFDDNGQPTYETPVEIDCRWEDVVQEFVDNKGNRNVSKSVVYVDRDMKVGGVLLLGELDSGSIDEENPLQNEGAFEIRQVSKIPNLKNTEYLRVVYL